MDVTVKEAQDGLKEAKEYSFHVYDMAKKDLHFLSDDEYAQWNQSDYEARVSSGRPALTIDQLSQFVHQVENDIRQNTPSINIVPSSMDSDKDNAEVRKGLIRHILYSSNADTVFDTAASYAVRCSIGFMRVDHKYTNDRDFEQDLCLKRVVNPLAVYLDKNSIELDGSDAKEAWVIEEISVDEFKKRYPGKDPVSFGDESSGVSEETVSIAEYFCIKEEKKDFAYKDGKTVEAQDDVEYEARRSVTKRKVMRYVLSGADVLEEAKFPGKYIPIVPVYGEEMWVDGKRQVYSLIRRAKEAQRMFNYWKSLETELLQKQPQSPFLAAIGQVEDFAQDWTNPGKASVLRYKQTDSEGQPAPPPSRLEPPVIPTGVVNASRSVVEDIKAAIGVYGSALGMTDNAVSGVAIDGRKVEGEVATYHFTDNLEKSIAHVGKILLAAMPEIYDTQRVIRIIDGEEEAQMIGINGAPMEDQDQEYDLMSGEYDVQVEIGKAYTTRRKEAAEFYADIVTGMPELMPVMGDLLFKYSDITGSEAMAERMKKTIDPKYLDDEEVDVEKMQMAEQLQQAQQQIEALAMQLQDKSQAEANKMQLEQEKLQVELRKLQGDIEEANIDYQEKLIQAETDSEKLQLEREKLALEGQKLELERLKIELETGREVAQAMPQTIVYAPETDNEIGAALEGLAGAVKRMNGPKRVVRDENGDIIGSESVE